MCSHLGWFATWSGPSLSQWVDMARRLCSFTEGQQPKPELFLLTAVGVSLGFGFECTGAHFFLTQIALDVFFDKILEKLLPVSHCVVWLY